MRTSSVNEALNASEFLFNILWLEIRICAGQTLIHCIDPICAIINHAIKCYVFFLTQSLGLPAFYIL